jgi:hypothetical protein
MRLIKLILNVQEDSHFKKQAFQTQQTRSIAHFSFNKSKLLDI